jgi:hypothetical protein
MRTSTLGSVVFSLIALSTPAAAQVVSAFDGTRCYSGAVQYWLTGNGMTGPNAQLAAHGYTVQTLSTVSTANLSGSAIFVTGELLLGSSLTPSEAADLQTWVAGGGSVLYLGEGNSVSAANSQFISLFSAGSYLGELGLFGVTMTISAPTHPLISGPFGTVTTISGMNVPGRWSAAAGVTVVAQNPDASGALLALQYGSGRVVLVNDSNYFCYPPTYSSDHAILWDNTIDWLAHTTCTGSATSYCTAGTTTNGCVATMAASGVPSAAATSGFTLSCSNVEGQKNGLVFYGISGPNGVSWGTGSTSFLCVKTPTQRTLTQNSGGAPGSCAGALTLDWNLFIASNPGALGQPFSGGETVWAQGWFRDPPAVKTTNLSNGLMFVECP